MQLFVPRSSRAQDTPAFLYDSTRTIQYLREPSPPASAVVDSGIGVELSQLVDEIEDGPWLPLYSDYSSAQAGGRGPGEWVFTRPAEQFLALSQAAPYMTAAQKAKARQLLVDQLGKSSPTRQLYGDFANGKPRNIRRAPPIQLSQPGDDEKQRELFFQAYAVWSFASAFDAWEQARPCFDDLIALRKTMENRGDFMPAYKPGQDAILTASVAADPEYRFTVYESLLYGFQDNYGYAGAHDAREKMQKGKPVFFHIKFLASLIGYHRLADHYGNDAEKQWAQATFNRIAGLTLSQQAAPYLWSDETMTPEIATLLRDHAGPWLDELSKTKPVGNLQARDWDNKLVPGRRDRLAIDPYTWYAAWGGQGEGVRPRTVMGAFLVNAWLFNAPASKIAETRDIPWCKADLFYLRKLAVVAQMRAMSR